MGECVNTGLKTALLLALYLIMAFVLVRLVDFSTLTQNLESADLLLLVPFAIVHCLTLLPIGLEFKALMEYYSVRLKFQEWFGLSVISNLGNYLAPMRAGFLVKAVYLKKKFGFSYSSFATTFVAAHLASIVVFGLFGLCALGLTAGYPGNGFGFFFLLVTLAGAGIWFFPAVRIPSALPAIFEKPIRKLAQVQSEWLGIRRNRPVVSKLVLVNLTTVALTAFRLYAGFRIFGTDIGIGNAMLLAAVYVIISLVPITPSGLGFREAGIVVAAKLVGIAGDAALLVSVLDRVTVILIVFVLGAFFSYWLGLRNEPVFQKNPQ